MGNISLPVLRTQYVTWLNIGIHTMYCVMSKLTILCLIYGLKIAIFLYFIFKNYSIIYIDIIFI